MKLYNNFYLLRKITIIGLALFSMFFGAGNIIFPLHIGANAGEHISIAAIGFIISGVGVPFLALIATSQYMGDYWAFFNRLGKIPAFLIVSLLMIVIGPLSAMPRTGIITFNSLSQYLPETMNNPYVFGIFYFTLVYLFALRESKIIDIIGSIFSPVKIILFILLVLIGLDLSNTSVVAEKVSYEIFSESLLYGYSTMDMFGAFFFCTLAFNSLKNQDIESDSKKIKAITIASIIGGVILASVYLGFLYLGYSHANLLKNIPQEELITVIAHEILGKFGGAFVCIAVSFACLSTAIALARVCTYFLYREVLNRKISSQLCLYMVVFCSYCTSILGFQTLLHIVLPIVEVIYPCLIIYSIGSILFKLGILNNTFLLFVQQFKIKYVGHFVSWLFRRLLTNFKFK